jgi:DNA polymerase III epsilon subunit-like protein
MRFCSVDLETTALSPDDGMILSIGARAVDLEKPYTSWPSFHVGVQHDKIYGMPQALAMNGELIGALANVERTRTALGTGVANYQGEKIQVVHDVEVLSGMFARWLKHNFGDTVVPVAGKNFNNLDRPFLSTLPHFNGGLIDGYFHYRTIDPAPLFWIPKTDTYLPSTEKCCERAGIPLGNLHNALNDATVVGRLIKFYYNGSRA